MFNIQRNNFALYVFYVLSCSGAIKLRLRRTLVLLEYIFSYSENSNIPLSFNTLYCSLVRNITVNPSVGCSS